MRLYGHEIQAMATDVDGTLAATADVSELAGDAMRRLEQGGVRTIIITGRSESRAVAIARHGGSSAPVISCNGAIVTDPATLAPLAVHYMSADDIGATLAAARELELQPFLWSRHDIWTDRAGALTDEIEAINAEPATVSDELPDTSLIAKVMLGADPAHLDEVQSQLRSRLPRGQRSMSTFFEASPAGAGKWEALTAVLERLGIAPAATLGFGDGDNDIEWLSHIGLPVAVGNAGPGVLAVAATVIGDHQDDAVAHFLLDWMAAPA